jgi:hypothetical protein
MNRRALVEHLLRKHELVLTRVMSSQSHDRFGALKNLEQAEKRFLLSFLASLASGSYWLSTELWGLNLSDFLTLPVNRVVSIILGAVIVVTSLLAVLAYLSVGLVIQRAVEIKPRD